MVIRYKQESAIKVIGFVNRLGLLDGYRVLRTCVTKPQVAILMYHRVEPRKNPWFSPYSVTIPEFENQIIYLLKHYTILPLNDLVDRIYEHKPLPKKAVVITFDDGYRDVYLHAYPILKRYGIPATVFLTTGPVVHREPFWWDKITYVLQRTACNLLELDELGLYQLKSNYERLGAASVLVKRLARLPEQEKNLFLERIINMSGVSIPAGLGGEIVLSWDDVREMNRGGITIGAHSANHSMMSGLSPEEISREITQSKKDIEENIEYDVTAFSYPSGRFHDGVAKCLKDNGFRCALTSIPNMTTSESNPYELGRVVGGWTFGVFKVFLSGLYTDVHALASRMNILEKIEMDDGRMIPFRGGQ
jgi:peptidoglycan/xylan/chitin deacetylase (PgdA/CDA1 family)